jgi:mono/diheme cytochrome c family protein
VITETRSLMPEYGKDRLSDAELDDIVAYLATLRGPVR